MLKQLHFYIKLILLFFQKKIISKEIIQEDYDLLAPTYDDYFSIYTKPHSQNLIKKLNIQNGTTSLDLACGTGVITKEVTRNVGSAGHVIAVDLSNGMIQKAKEKMDKNVEFICGDMLNIIDGFEAEHFDYITCGWAIGYSDPLQLFKKIARLLKRGGKIGIIENKRDTLAPLRETGIKVMQRYPQHIRYVMDLPFRLPRNVESLRKLFVKAGLRPLNIWDGEVRFNFKNGTDVLNWSLHTGASAGFSKIMDPKVRVDCDNAFIEIMDRNYKGRNGIDILHKYAAGIAQKI